MPLDKATSTDIWKLRDTLISRFESRNQKWMDRRRLRYRRMDEELLSLPLNPRVSTQSLMVHQTELPNQDCHRRVKRLIANKPRFEVILADSAPDSQKLGQALEDGLKALYKWMSRGRVSVDWQLVEHQQGDGLGIYKIDFVPGHGSVLRDFGIEDILSGEELKPENIEEPEVEGAARERRNQARRDFQKELGGIRSDDLDREAKAYNRVVDQALHKEIPPFRLSAVDPLTCAWYDDADLSVAVMCESGKKSLHPLLKDFAEYGLKISDNRLVVTDDGSEAVSGRTVPDYVSSPKDLSEEVQYTEIRTKTQIVILIEHPVIEGKLRSDLVKSGDRGVVMYFDNPFGPYSTGYELVPGDITTESTPEDQFQPPILGLLTLAQAENVLMTAQLSAALEAALAPAYIQVPPDAQLPPADESKTPESQQGREIPMVQGEIKRAESPKTPVERVEARIAAEADLFRFQESLLGEATSDTSGHRLAIQVAQADIQAVPYQNARADALVGVMKAILYAVRKHGLAIYIPTIPESSRTGPTLRVAEPAVLLPEMANLNCEILVTLGAETPVTKYAKWQALAQREQQGTVGYQTVVEQSDTENPEEEIARVFEGKLLKAVMEAVLPEVAKMVIQAVQARLAAVLNPPAESVGGNIPMGGLPPETGLAAGGGGMPGPADMVRLPGVNMPVVQSTSEYGPSVPEPAELGGVRI